MQGILKLDWGTIADAVVMAALAAVAAVIYGVATTSGFNVFTANWVQIGENIVNAGFISAVISFAQNFLSTNSGSLLGITPPNTPA